MDREAGIIDTDSVLSGLFTKEKMDDCKDLNEANRDYDNTSVYFKGLVEHMNRFTKNNGSTAEVNKSESAANVEGKRRVDDVMETLTRQMERAEEENDRLWEATSGTYSNDKKAEDKFDQYTNGKRKLSTTCWRSSTIWRANLQD